MGGSAHTAAVPIWNVPLADTKPSSQVEVRRPCGLARETVASCTKASPKLKEYWTAVGIPSPCKMYENTSAAISSLALPDHSRNVWKVGFLMESKSVDQAIKLELNTINSDSISKVMPPVPASSTVSTSNFRHASPPTICNASTTLEEDTLKSEPSSASVPMSAANLDTHRSLRGTLMVYIEPSPGKVVFAVSGVPINCLKKKLVPAGRLAKLGNKTSGNTTPNVRSRPLADRSAWLSTPIPPLKENEYIVSPDTFKSMTIVHSTLSG